MKMRIIYRLLSVVLIGLLLTGGAYSREFVGAKKNAGTIKGTAAGCSAASGFRFLDINNIRARINTGGDMWWDLPGGIGAQYYIPKTGTATSMFSGSLWIGGLDINNQLKLAAIRYRQVGNDYWPGPLTTDGTAAVDQETCAKYDKHFLITRLEVDEFLGWWNSTNKAEEYPGYSIPKSILEWPAHGDVAKLNSYYLAPFRDVDGDGEYDPNNGDYPYYDITNELCPINFAGDPSYIPARTMEEDLTEYKVALTGSILVDQVIKGDQTLWWVFNDKGNTHTETQGAPIGMEVRAQAFGFATNDEINNMSFYSYEVINRSTFELTNTYFCPWVDTDLGYAWDDYVGCDVLRGLGYCYNGVAIDGSGEPESYGAQPPAIGVDFFQGPYIDPDGFDNPRFTGDCSILGQGPNFEVDQMAINGVNFGNGIVDDERYGMRRFVYHNNTSSNPATTDPGVASEYYNFLRGIWKDNSLMLYGGTAHNIDAAAVGPICEFMFPGDSDPCNWGTKFQPPNGGYNQNGKYWTEEESGNEPGDRRFMQSAGPFTLKPGAVNYITVGIPWARAASGGPWASVELLRVVDDKCQALFDNCFKVIDGPDAPDLIIRELDRELIVFIDNPKGSNNYLEQYAEFDPNIIQPNPANSELRSDSIYRFEGYQIFQLKDASVTLGDAKDEYGNFNPDMVRLVAQFDVKNGVGRIINHYFNKAIGFNIPVVEVEGGDEGIQHSFRITDDAFASGDKRLVNHKQYYYTVVAYAYNEYLPYDPEDVIGKMGQKKAYLPGRKNIVTYTAIPHKTINGLVMNSTYGDGPAITRIEGQGNDGMILDLTPETIEEILSKQPVGTVIDGDTVDIGHPLYPIAYEAKYVNGFGPLNIKIIDPLNVPTGKYYVRFDTLYTMRNFNVTGNTALIAGGDTASYITGSWTLVDSLGREFKSDATLDKQNEQLFLDFGISINMKSFYTPGPKKVGQKPDQNGPITIYEVLADNNGVLESSVTYQDSSYIWLGGVVDNDVPNDPRNWIRAGTYQDGNSSDWNMPSASFDPNQNFERLASGTWAPFVLTAANDQDINGPAYSIACKERTFMEDVFSVDIVFTPDKSKWSRSLVIEMCPDANLSQGKAARFQFRRAPSIDKDGNPASGGSGPSSDPNAANYVSDSSMSWFPGYAINVETGERLNIVFGEDSWLVEDNGRDMKYNPTSSIFDPVSGNARFGGKHYVYIMDHVRRDLQGRIFDFPAYDGCKYIRNGYGLNDLPPFLYELAWMSTAMWVGMPLSIDGKEWLNNEVKIRIRVAKPYKRFYSTTLDSASIANSQNGHMPMYRFETQSVATQLSDPEKAKSDLDLIQVVPNPYYAYAGGDGYERNALDNRIKITNLPERCTISIYNVNGTLIRQITKDEPKTSVDWDLKNFAGVPIAGGVYIIHVKADNGEKILKWFGGLRVPDLNVF